MTDHEDHTELNIMTHYRNVADLVKKEHFVLDSEYLSTLLVRCWTGPTPY